MSHFIQVQEAKDIVGTMSGVYTEGSAHLAWDNAADSDAHLSGSEDEDKKAPGKRKRGVKAEKKSTGGTAVKGKPRKVRRQCVLM